MEPPFTRAGGAKDTAMSPIDHLFFLTIGVAAGSVTGILLSAWFIVRSTRRQVREIRRKP